MAYATDGKNKGIGNIDGVRVYCHAPAKYPDLYILSIGIDYSYKGLTKLGLSCKDAQDIAALLKKQATLLYGKVDSKLLLDKHATKTVIMDAMRQIGKKIMPEDVFLLFLSGNGTYNYSDGSYYFIPFIEQSNEQITEKQMLSASDLYNLLKNIKAMRQILIVDSSYSGRLCLMEPKLYDGRLSTPSNTTGIHVLTSGEGQSVEISHGEIRNGLFTHFVVKGLQGEADVARQGVVRVRDLGPYLEKMLQQAIEKKDILSKGPQILLMGQDVELTTATPPLTR
ncbi:MAG: hypothetical protein FJ128_05190 [Deltaproteobacteria bacterium]|nr:hypothetical protein [Deltaproteobacteria bacterium]MBM4284628.1 hypothetical protein [Deltaproteobacteria bacterium]